MVSILYRDLINEPFDVTYQLAIFDNLPERAQRLFLSYLSRSKDKGCYLDIHGFPDCRDLESPIEKLYLLADSIISWEIGEYFMDCIPQHEICCGSKKYRVDFFYDNACAIEHGDYARLGLFENPLNLIVECDGHDFHHKTKGQVKCDNERQLALQMAGYEVVRFSGTQIYENPLKCADSVYRLAVRKLGGVKIA